MFLLLVDVGHLRHRLPRFFAEKSTRVITEFVRNEVVAYFVTESALAELETFKLT